MREIKDLNRANFPELDWEIQSIDYIGLPMPDADFVELPVFGSVIGQSIDEFCSELKSDKHLKTCSPLGSDEVWELKAYKKMVSINSQEELVLLYYSPASATT